MAAFDSLIKDILPYVPNCPDSLVESTLRSACIEFAERSKAYVYDLDPITTISGVYMNLINQVGQMYTKYFG